MSAIGAEARGEVERLLPYIIRARVWEGRPAPLVTRPHGQPAGAPWSSLHAFADTDTNGTRPTLYIHRTSMLFRISSLISGSRRGQREKRSYTVLLTPGGLGGAPLANLSPTTGELYAQAVRLPFWPA